MKIALLLALLLSILFAQERPKIALVLSGGGARGGAHVGVLKVLEEYRIPIDMVVGTSMGSFVGGLYASGESPQDIEKMLTSTQWKKYIRTDFERQDIPMRKKNIDYIYQGRLGLGINVKNELVLPTGVLKRQPLLLKFLELTKKSEDIKDFDKLNIPYRAVATDIKNGDAVILKSGSLAKAIYASSSIPGGFQPINIDGKDLVDGGVSKNFPIEVALDMGADIIIAVDVSENFDKKLDVNSYFVVMGQLVNILMRKNANESIEKLREDDILLTPDLKGFSGLDADKYSAIIQKGVEVTLHAKKRLAHLALSESEYAHYKVEHQQRHIYKVPIIDAIEIENPSYLSDDSIRMRIHQKEGEAFDEAQLSRDIMHIYNMMIFDSIDYQIERKERKNILHIKTTPSWDNHGELRFAIGLEDDFSGHSAYSLKLGYTMFGLTSYGAEWRSDFEIGRYEKAHTELFLPFDAMQRYYARPFVKYSGVTDMIPSQNIVAMNLGNQEIYSSRAGGGLALGMHIGTSYELEVGLAAYKDYVRLDMASLLGLNPEYNYTARPLYALINIDNLDNVNFPKLGVKSELKWIKEMNSLGSDYNYEQIYFEIEKPFRFYSNNITSYFKIGDTYAKRDKALRREGQFILGGLFNLSGYEPYSFIGDNVALGVLKYTYEIKDGGFFGSLNAPLYAGFSLEMGQTWSNNSKNLLTYEAFKKSGTLYVAADTFLGPLYLAYGASVDGHESVYLYLGEKF